MNKCIRVKICGITSISDAQAAVAAGADAIGLVFYERSPRGLSIDCAAQIAATIPSMVSVVGLFVDAEVGYVEKVLDKVALDQLQFHGNESAAFCRQFKRRYIKAVPMNNLMEVGEIASYIADYDDASGLLFDAHGGGVSGGSGKRFGWRELPRISQPVIIAGGLQADNIGEVVEYYQPFALDVSSGVENTPGVKSSVKMNHFMKALKQINDEYNEKISR